MGVSLLCSPLSLVPVFVFLPFGVFLLPSSVCSLLAHLIAICLLGSMVLYVLTHS